MTKIKFAWRYVIFMILGLMTFWKVDKKFNSETNAACCYHGLNTCNGKTVCGSCPDECEKNPNSYGCDPNYCINHPNDKQCSTAYTEEI